VLPLVSLASQWLRLVKASTEVAAALVRVDNKGNFKRLLIVCAYYLEAAYRMFGLLARLYPEQAGKVAEVVMNG
jgi:hypothetical protein